MTAQVQAPPPDSEPQPSPRLTEAPPTVEEEEEEEEECARGMRRGITTNYSSIKSTHISSLLCRWRPAVIQAERTQNKYLMGRGAFDGETFPAWKGVKVEEKPRRTGERLLVRLLL